jgi:flagellar FliL protein
MGDSDELRLLEGPAQSPKVTVAAWLGAMAALTLLAIVAGSLVGLTLVGTIKQGMRNTSKPELQEPLPAYSDRMRIHELAPIITNLAHPSNTWIRLQAAIVFDSETSPKPDADAALIAADILAFLRTLPMEKIGGASGLQHLREELTDRAVIRTEGRVRELIIQTLVVQ